MRFKFWLLVALVVAAVAPAAAAASPGDVLAGSGLTATQPGSGGELTVGAQSGPQGEDPWGTITLEDPFPKPPEQDTYRVVCLSVANNVATAVGRSIDSATPDKGIVVTVTDNGDGSSGVPDQLAVLVLPELPPAVASDCTPAPGLEPLTHGNFTVEDR